MELYKLENDTLKKFKGGFVVLNNRIYTNPTEKTARKVGYKNAVFADKPEYDEATQYLKPVYTEDDTTYYVSYEVADIPEMEEGENNEKEGVTNDD